MSTEKEKTMTKKEKKVGLPRNPMPDRINATPDQILDAVLKTPPKKANEWRYLKKGK